jgi:hypothetical protein
VPTTKVERPVFHKDLGDFLKGVREHRGWSLQQAVNVAAGKKLPALTWNKLRLIEAGKTKLPDPDVLRAVAAIYGLNYLELAVPLVEETYGLHQSAYDLSRHEGTKASSLPKVGGADVLATARIRELEPASTNSPCTNSSSAGSVPCSLMPSCSLAQKAARLQQLRPAAAAVVEALIDDALAQLG